MPGLINLRDNELIFLLKKDDQAAFTEIYNRYALTLADFAGSKLYSLEDARDVLHDLFAKLWEDRRSINGDINLKAYLFSAVRYKVIDKIRSKSVREKYAEGAKFTLPAEYSAQDKMEAQELQRSIYNALEGLTPRAREIFLLSRNDHKSIAEIAKLLNLSEQTVKNQISAALKHLRKSIGNNLLIGLLMVLLMSVIDKNLL